jgi:Ca-activated chloride channel family protein
MKRKSLRNLLLIAVLIAATGAAMAYSSKTSGIFSMISIAGQPQPQLTKSGVLTVSGHLTQDKVLQGSKGTVGLNLTLKADEIISPRSLEIRGVDMVIVLDRSGSMSGRKINDARRAILNLLSSLSAGDRFALITYSDRVQIASELEYVTPGNQRRMKSAVQAVRIGGGTNLGAGLQAGINLLRTSTPSPNPAKVILISDGLANRGITDVRALSRMATVAVESDFAVSTVGVGAEFNEYLMTAIADQGTGNYYYLENPAAFAEVFQLEFHNTRSSVVNNLKIQIPLSRGINLSDAAGYPINRENGYAVIYPGNLRSGQTRKLYLTLLVPTNTEKDFELNNIRIGYYHNDRLYETKLEESFKIACVADRRKVFSSIDKTLWSDKVINEDFNRLKQEVAADMKSGKKQTAMKRIKKYYGEQQVVNEMVGSARVTENLDKDLKELETYVEETFQGAPEVVREKQKSNAKALQYDGYRGRRK